MCLIMRSKSYSQLISLFYMWDSCNPEEELPWHLGSDIGKARTIPNVALPAANRTQWQMLRHRLLPGMMSHTKNFPSVSYHGPGK